MGYFDNEDFNANSYDDDCAVTAKIKVIGVGGAGNNAINRMKSMNLESAKLYAVNTELQTLKHSKADKTLPIGEKLTRGLGAGSNYKIGEAAAKESAEDIKELLKDTDMLFITAGMGGGTGTGAAPVIAKIAKDMGILTVAVVTKPFAFEGAVRESNANIGITNLAKAVDTLIIIPNDKIQQVYNANIKMKEGFRLVDEILSNGIKNITDLIVLPSEINLDFADVRTVMAGKGLAHMGMGIGKGEHRMLEAIKMAVASPLLATTIEGATHILLNIISSEDLTIDEMSNSGTLIKEVVDSNANIIIGWRIDESFEDTVKVSIIATGIESSEYVPYEEEEEQESEEKTENKEEEQKGAYQDIEDIEYPEYIKKLNGR